MDCRSRLFRSRCWRSAVRCIVFESTNFAIGVRDGDQIALIVVLVVDQDQAIFVFHHVDLTAGQVANRSLVAGWTRRLEQVTFRVVVVARG